MPRTRPPADPVKAMLDSIRPPKHIAERAMRGAMKAPPLPPARLGVSTKTVCEHCGQNMDLANPVHVAHHNRPGHRPMTRALKSKRWRL